MYIFLAMMVPLAMGSIIIMAPDASISMLMLYQYHILYTFLAALLEKSQDTQSGLFLADAGKVRAGRILGYVVAAVLLLVGYQNFVVTNQAYFRMGIAYEDPMHITTVSWKGLKPQQAISRATPLR